VPGQDALLHGVITVALFLVASLFGMVDGAGAEPYMAIREGRKCSTCHVNMTGGGMRTLLANTHLEEITHYREIFPELGEAAEVFNGQLTSFLSIGGDLRVDDSIVFQDKPNAEGEVPNNEVFRGRVDENVLDIRQATLYGDLKLVPDYLSAYLDVSFAPDGVVAREVFGLVRGLLPAAGYVKAGRFFLDYGLRTANIDLFSQGNESQNIFVRSRTGSDFTSFDEGVEIGFEPGPLHFSTSVTDSASGDASVRSTTNAYTVFRGLPVVESAMLGGSFMYSAPTGFESYVYGFYAGANLGPLEYQAEVDFIHVSTDDASPAVSTFLAYGEVNYLLLDWINTKFFGEYADDDGRPDATNTAQNRFGVGIEPFLGRFLQTSLFYSIANGPKDRPETNQNRIVIELHLFF
jgi:hypothetical protein